MLLMLPDVPQFASAWFAAVKAGGVVSAVSPDLKPEEVRYYLNYTRAKILVCDALTLPALDAVRAECPHLEQVLVVGGAGKSGLDYDAELQRAVPDPTFAPTHRDDAAVWLYTSGSTGFPKAAVHKHHDFIFNALTYDLAVDLPARIKAGAKDFLECGGTDAYFGTPASATAAEGHRLFEILAEISEAALGDE